MFYVTKGSLDAIAAKQKRLPIKACSKYEGSFLLVQPGTEKPAAKVPYVIRKDDGKVIRGVTDENGRTQKVEGKKPERLKLELVKTVISVDVKGKETGRQTEKVQVAEGVTQCAPFDDPIATAKVGDGIQLVVKECTTANLKHTKDASVRGYAQHVVAPLEKRQIWSVHLRLTVGKPEEKALVPYSREALVVVHGLEVEAAQSELWIAPPGDPDAALEKLVIPLNPSKLCKDGAPCVIVVTVEVVEPPRVYFTIYYSNQKSDKNFAFKRAAESWKEAIEAGKAMERYKDLSQPPAFRKGTDLFYELSVTSKLDFQAQWWTLYNHSRKYKIVQGWVFTHASEESLLFIEMLGHDDELTSAEIKALPVLGWARTSHMILSGCDSSETGVEHPTARTLAESQFIEVTGQSGKGYFSLEWDRYEPINESDSTTKPIYLWSYSRTLAEKAWGRVGKRPSGAPRSPGGYFDGRKKK
jgi:hypothetical protein